MLIALATLFVVVRAAHSEEVDALKPPAIVTRSVPVVPAEIEERLRQYQNTRAAAFHGWSPDGKGLLIATRFGNTAQLHRVYEPSGRRDQITFFDEPVTGRFIPKATDGALLLSMSQGGSERDQIYLFDAASGHATRLTDGRSRNQLQAVTRDGSKIAFASNARNGRDTDLYVLESRVPGSLKLVLKGDGEFWEAHDWSGDGSRLLINRFVSINESYPGVLDVATGNKRMIPIPAKPPVSFESLRFSPDSKTVYLATDAHGEFRQLARLELDTLRYTWLTENIPWDVDAIEVEPKTGRVAFTVNEDGANVLYLLARDQPARIEHPPGVITGLEFSPDGSRLGFTLARYEAPPDAYSINLADRKLVRWTYSEMGGLNPATFMAPATVRFTTFDGRKIPAYIYRPRGASRETPVPVLISIHGGPEGQYRPFFSGLEQFFINELGFAVIAPNVRGSAGYGKTYLKLDNADKREDSVRDIGGLLDWIATQPDLDAKRVAVMGGSYGGYMVLASLTHYSERIRAGVDIVGVASFNTMLKTTSAYRRDLRRAEYGDERDPKMQAFFRRTDPLNNAGSIHSALLVAHGRNDPRVPFSEAEQIVAKVRANGNTVWTVYADNEGHGFQKKANRDYLNDVIALFLKRNLAP
ncbi:MAG TPA: alpha/beta fold hydrolase [Planctomycetaceae bacterium]|jgi:dipeptidyl aminopeptidase/acylaminoacyl peptidase|nr:alpha/beta fold hydrolase [Planctomycetaceae bacterium]